VPFIVIAALALNAVTGGNGGDAGKTPTSGPLATVSAAAPPQAKAQFANCTKVLQLLPVSLRSLAPRIVHTRPDTPFVVAWGNPAIVFSCGAARPASLTPGSNAQFQSGGELRGPYYDVTRRGDANVWTTVDREPYVSITIPRKYQGADYIPVLSGPIARALPPVCSTSRDEPDVTKLCTRRK